MTAPSAAGPDVWDRGIVLWDLAFLLAVAAAVGVALGADGMTDGGRVRAVAALVALAGWYVAVGVRAVHRWSTVLGLVYTAGMIPLFLFAFAQYATLGFLLFLLYAQPWTMTQRLGLAVAADAVLAVGVGAVAFLVHHESWLAAVTESSSRRSATGPACWPSGSGWPGRSTTRSPRASPRWWCCWSWPSPTWTPTRPRPGGGSPPPGRPPGRTWPRPGRWSPRSRRSTCRPRRCRRRSPGWSSGSAPRPECRPG